MAERCPHTTEAEGPIPSVPTVRFLKYFDKLIAREKKMWKIVFHEKLEYVDGWIVVGGVQISESALHSYHLGEKTVWFRDEWKLNIDACKMELTNTKDPINVIRFLIKNVKSIEK